MNMRAAPQDNPQQKMLLWFMPILMVVIFLNFASGLNLYYAASNVASLPQQILIIRERKRHRVRMDAKKAREAKESRDTRSRRGEVAGSVERAKEALGPASLLSGG
jgi:YidC/Oxa1 family membrane protein insertase